MGDFKGALYQDMRGLRPRAWVVVGKDFSREEVKSQFLEMGALVGGTIRDLTDVLVALTGVPSKQVLKSESRQEILFHLLSKRRLSSQLPELRRLKRQRGFFKKLDRSVQAGRLAFSHSEEEAVFEERLRTRYGRSQVREDLQRLAAVYEAWMSSEGYWDPVTLLRRAIEVLEEGWPEPVPKPKRVVYLSVHRGPREAESLERRFWEALSERTEVSFRSDMGDVAQENASPEWETWHSLDDACERVAYELAGKNEEDPKDHCVLIPETGSARRSLFRALGSADISVMDEFELGRMQEELKKTLVPLQVVSSRYERTAVQSWVAAYIGNSLGDRGRRVPNEINSRGIRQGLEAYRGGFLAPIHDRLKTLEETFHGKHAVAELAEKHLEYLKNHELSASSMHLLSDLWKRLETDLARVGGEGRSYPLLFLVERFRMRLDQHVFSGGALRPREGLSVFRLQHMPLLPDQRFEKVWVLGLPPSWLSEESSGDYWFSEKERQTLGEEFGVRSSVQVREERLRILKAWRRAGEKLVLLDSEYDFDGKEREGAKRVYSEVWENFVTEPRQMGAHQRWRSSFGTFAMEEPADVKLSKRSVENGGMIEATELDRYSRCSFQGLGAYRWKLRDLREPDVDLWPDTKGNILHKSVEILLQSRLPDGSFEISVASALEEAWALIQPRGLLRGRRIESYVQNKLRKILEEFCTQEKGYHQRSGTKIFKLEDRESLEWKVGDWTVRGRPDRIDEHPDGLFIMDNKTSSALPSGKEMVESGTYLQLPFYAVAARKTFGAEVLGVQFIQLNRKGSRTKGIFLKKYNGSKSGCLTKTRARLSLFEGDIEDIWKECEKELQVNVEAYAAGSFKAVPKSPAECRSCFYQDLCGKRRQIVTA